MPDLTRIIFLTDYNTRVVVFGVTCLGIAAGIIGTFLLLRKRSLTADALSHATLPGIALAFMIMLALGLDEKTLTGLLLGAFIFGLLGIGTIILIRRTTRLKDDAALGIVLSVYFGLGTALVKLAEDMPGGSAAGLDRYILGSAASMTSAHARTILLICVLAIIACIALFKELRLLCFDQNFAASQGFRVLFLDSILMGLVVAITVVGLQAVGLVLIIALLITPAAAARFWTDRLGYMSITAGLIGGISGYLGAGMSGIIERMPTGPIIVVVCASIFIFSMLLGTKRGVAVQLVRHILLARRVGMQHLLRALFELSESLGDPSVGVSFDALMHKRSWSRQQLRRLLHRANRNGDVYEKPGGMYALTSSGLANARRVVRNHRLWELYLIHYADIAPNHVDRDADEIEHILQPSMIDRLQQLLARESPKLAFPESPHELNGASHDVPVV